MNAILVAIAALTWLAACGGGGGGGGGSADGSRLRIADAQIDEGDAGERALVFTVTLDPTAATSISVDYATAPATATAPADFTATSGTLVFAAGVSSRTISVAIQGDTIDESNETFRVILSNASAGASVSDGSATGTIRDDDGQAQVPGLDARPSNATCLAPPRPTPGASVTTSDPFPTMPSILSMTKILQPPGDSTRWLVLQKAGQVLTFVTSNPAALSTWLDLTGRVNSDSEGGLLGLAFHPNYPATREIFVSYTSGVPMVSRISRIILDSTTAPVNTTEQILLTVAQPFANHNGGEIAFGPDGFLYISLGDGGSGNDPLDYGQNSTRLLGSVLRIGVVGVAFPSPGYAIPTDNPFAANPKCGPAANASSCPEIYAFGFRNPWRFSFDSATGALWLGDVGQDSWEEVDLVERGGNYGWRCREGAHDFNTAGCPSGGFIEPVNDYTRSEGGSITGGFVYRGTALPALVGRYVFGDFVSGRIWALRDDGLGGYTRELLVNSNDPMTSFAIGLDGELYVTDFYSGRIHRLIAAGAPVPDTIPSDLADTGCVSPGDPRDPADGLVPYGVSAPFWSDNAAKSRYLALPDGATIDVLQSGDWILPAGSVVVKHFRLGTRIVETRLLMRHPDGVWAGYTYEWNDAQTAATRVVGGKVRSVSGQSWIYPSEGDCMRCHTTAAGFSLGLTTAQLNGDLLYSSTGRTANQLATLEHIGYLSASLPDDPGNLPTIPDPSDTGQSLGARARAYLDTNCAQCHRPSGPTPSSMDLRYTTALSSTFACNATPLEGDLGIVNARIIAVGSASRSVLIARAGLRDAHGMPPLGSGLVDGAGLNLLTTWVNSLANCQ